MAKVYTGRDGVMQLAGATLAKVVSFSVSKQPRNAGDDDSGRWCQKL